MGIGAALSPAPAGGAVDAGGDVAGGTVTEAEQPCRHPRCRQDQVFRHQLQAGGQKDHQEAERQRQGELDEYVDDGRVARMEARLAQLARRLVGRRAAQKVQPVRQLAHQRSRRLLTAARLYGQDEVPLSQDDLAGLAGTARATVNRVLRAEVKRGTLELGRRRIKILDRAAIEKRAT